MPRSIEQRAGLALFDELIDELAQAGDVESDVTDDEEGGDLTEPRLEGTLRCRRHDHAGRPSFSRRISGCDTDALLAEAFGPANVGATDDVHLHRVEGGVPFAIDHLDERFWSVHTTVPTSVAAPYLKGIVEAWRELDWMWLPSDHLRDVWPGTHPVSLATDFSGRRGARIR